MTLARYLALLVGIPLAGVIILGTVFTRAALQEKLTTDRESQRIGQLGELAVVISGLVHELQRERGRSAAFMGGNGEVEYGTALRAQHRESDQRLIEWDRASADASLDSLGAEFIGALSEIQTMRRKLDSVRSAIQQGGIAPAEAVAYYSIWIDLQLGLISRMSGFTRSAEVAKGIDAYVFFLSAKENMGIERAVLSNTFAQDKFNPDLYRRFITVVTRQDVYLRAFSRVATNAQIREMESTLRGDAVEQVAAMRKRALDRWDVGGFEVDASAWFDTITRKIDLAKEVEDVLSADVLALSASLRSTAARQMVTALSIALLTLIISTGAGLWIARILRRQLAGIAVNLNEASQTTAAASGEIATASQSLAEGAAEQASALEETGSSLEEITSTMAGTQEQASESAELGSRTLEESRSAGVAVKSLRGSAEGAIDAVGQMNRAMAGIEESSRAVASVIKSIDEIAFQTNILALNAAVEAARAGEAGAGFSVVADEVRALARRAAEAARETTSLIESSITRARDGVKVNAGVNLSIQSVLTKSTEVESSLDSISSYAGRVNDAMQEMLRVTVEQRSGVEQINTAVEQINQVTQESAANSEEVASTAHELEQQARLLDGFARELSALMGIRAAVNR